MRPQDVVGYWLEAGPTRWFRRDAAFDGALSVRFGAALEEARLGACDHWGDTPEGALGLVILLDQVSRNIHRGSPLAFAADAKALTLARNSIRHGFQWNFPPPVAGWLIMPFEHAEDVDAQQRGVALFEVLGDHEAAHWAEVHRDIIARFGRFPHRNSILGRLSTPEELSFLAAGGFAG